MKPLSFLQIQRGLTLIEVLVTVFILSVGLLGMAGLQSRLQQSEMEAYQRSQALTLLQDMANRIAVNRNAAASYVTTTTGIGGAGTTCPTTTSTTVQRDAGEWCNALQGAGETSGTSKVGAMIGGRGCVESLGDGYTWLLTTDNILTVNPHIGKTPFDPFKDFTFVMQLARFQFLLVVHPSVPAKSVQELVALAKAKPGTLNYGSSGNGSPQHLGAAMLQSLAGIQMHHIPYKGAAPAIIDLLPGRIQVWVGAANSTLPHIKDGKLRLLASAGSQRYPSLPDVPTVAEAGVPGFALDVSAGLTMPAKAPPAIVAKVNADVTKLLNAPDVKARLAPQGIEIATSSPAEYAKTVREENAVWGKIIKATGIKAD